MKNIIFENIYKSYGKTPVVKDLSMTINPGERLVLLGPSGCGKSTSLRMIAGLEGITDGKLYLGDKCVNNIPSGERGVSMVFQNYALFPHMTVEENIVYGLKVHKMNPNEVKVRLLEAVKMLELQGLEARKPKDLSGGQRQRVALARALVKRSDYFLLDEPLSNLDAQLRGHARKELVKIHQTYGPTMVYVTHDQVEAMTIGHRIALMYLGELQMIDTPHNVYNKPSNVFTAKFIGSPPMNVTQAKYSDEKIIVGNQSIDLPSEWKSILLKGDTSDIYFGIRPEHIYLMDDSEKDDSNSSVYFKGVVKYIEDYGNKYGIYIEIEGNEFIALSETKVFKSGDNVKFAAKSSNIHFFHGETTMSLGYPEVF